MNSSVKELLAAVKTLAVSSDIALRVPRDGQTEQFYTALAQIDNLIDDLKDALQELADW